MEQRSARLPHKQKVAVFESCSRNQNGEVVAVVPWRSYVVIRSGPVAEYKLKWINKSFQVNLLELESKSKQIEKANGSPISKVFWCS